MSQPDRCPVTSKIIHATRREAREHLRKEYQRRLREGSPISKRRNVLRCSWCEFYHIGRPRGHGGGKA